MSTPEMFSNYTNGHTSYRDSATTCFPVVVAFSITPILSNQQKHIYTCVEYICLQKYMSLICICMICVFVRVLVYAFMYFYVYMGQVPEIKLMMMICREWIRRRVFTCTVGNVDASVFTLRLKVPRTTSSRLKKRSSPSLTTSYRQWQFVRRSSCARW